MVDSLPRVVAAFPLASWRIGPGSLDLAVGSRVLTKVVTLVPIVPRMGTVDSEILQSRSQRRVAILPGSAVFICVGEIQHACFIERAPDELQANR
jgi:hypothetical protein